MLMFSEHSLSISWTHTGSSGWKEQDERRRCERKEETWTLHPGVAVHQEWMDSIQKFLSI